MEVMYFIQMESIPLSMELNQQKLCITIMLEVGLNLPEQNI